MAGRLPDERLVQQRFDIGLIGQTLSSGETLRQGDIRLGQPDREETRENAVETVFWMFVPSHPSGSAGHFGNIAGVDLIVR